MWPYTITFSSFVHAVSVAAASESLAARDGCAACEGPEIWGVVRCCTLGAGDLDSVGTCCTEPALGALLWSDDERAVGGSIDSSVDCMLGKPSEPPGY